MAQTGIVLLEKVSIRERVGRALRAAIVSGEMEPGTVYSAPSLGARFGVSATPVREAMIDLVREGLVEIVPNKGFRVTAIDEADLIAEHYVLLDGVLQRDGPCFGVNFVARQLQLRLLGGRR